MGNNTYINNNTLHTSPTKRKNGHHHQVNKKIKIIITLDIFPRDPKLINLTI